MYAVLGGKHYNNGVTIPLPTQSTLHSPTHTPKRRKGLCLLSQSTSPREGLYPTLHGMCCTIKYNYNVCQLRSCPASVHASTSFHLLRNV
jgi:hypothetical protein